MPTQEPALFPESDAPNQIRADTDEIAEHHTEQRRQVIEDLIADRVDCWRREWREVLGWLAGDPRAVDMFRRLLLHVDRYMDVLLGKRIYSDVTYPPLWYALAALAFYHERWIRTIESWASPVPRSGHPERRHQFAALVHHLLARYEVPTFLNRVWFEGVGARGREQQQWYLHLAMGGSVSDLDLPVDLTKRMAHLFRNAPRGGHVDRNMRWAQVIGMGGSMDLANAVTTTRLGRTLEHDAFWQTVIQFLANNAMVDPAWAGPLVDYIHNMKFAPRHEVQEGGGIVAGPPPHPNLSMKGRSAMKLLRQVEAWHEQLGREEDVIYQSWQPCGSRPWEVGEETETLGKVRWTVQELTSSYELAAHGREMGHCVVSYSNRCADGNVAIWGIFVQREGQDEREGVLTVALDIRSRTVTQARGRHNMDPTQPTKLSRRNKVDTPGYVELLTRSNEILNQWIQRERLRRDR